ncbi:MAG: pyridoxal phosphate-dependent decarboxylase family protein [Thermoanaerobaculia bacterium]
MKRAAPRVDPTPASPHEGAASPSVRSRQLGRGHAGVLDGLEEAISGWAVPFLRAWIEAGEQPLPTDGEIAAILRETASGGQPPKGYAWLQELLERLAGSIRFNRRNFVNIHPTPHVPSVVASTLVSLQNPNNIVSEVSEATTRMEREVIEWMARELVRFPEPDRAWGNVVSGGTIANMTALMVARDYSYRKLARPRPADVRARGLYGLDPGVMLATAGSHYSVRKALWFLGMGDENVIRIPVAWDEALRRKARRDLRFLDGIRDRNGWRDQIVGALEAELGESWKEWITGSDAVPYDRSCRQAELDRFYRGCPEPFSLQPLDSEVFKALYGCFAYGTPLIAYVFTVGTTDTGTFERPSSQAVAKLKEEDVFIHADAAAGGFALADASVRAGLGEGLDHVDSITIDGHKLGHLAYPNGAVLFRDRGWVYEVLHEAPYLSGLAPTLEGSRPGSHVGAAWAAMKDLGESGGYAAWFRRLRTFVERLLDLLAESEDFQVLNRVDLTTLAVAPKRRGRESRRTLNELARRVSELSKADRRPEAHLVNFDRELCGIQVLDRWRSEEEWEADGRRCWAVGGPGADELVDVQCLRIVATNPAVNENDADALVVYLSQLLERARKEGVRE